MAGDDGVVSLDLDVSQMSNLIRINGLILVHRSQLGLEDFQPFGQIIDPGRSPEWFKLHCGLEAKMLEWGSRGQFYPFLDAKSSSPLNKKRTHIQNFIDPKGQKNFLGAVYGGQTAAVISQIYHIR